MQQALRLPGSVWVVSDSPADPGTSEFCAGRQLDPLHLAGLCTKEGCPIPTSGASFFQYTQPTFGLSFLICKMDLAKGGTVSVHLN